MIDGADRQIASLEGIVQDANSSTEEYAQLLSGSVSTVYDLEGETSTLQQTSVTRCAEITQLTRSNNMIKESWNQMTTANSALRAQPYLAESSFTFRTAGCVHAPQRGCSFTR